ncbi:MAG TPA: hypothetical protein VJ044_01800, partial [Candidatus Hodarchaeales archaeon]|nr:hypothetical protein [Candidatus Hodarchaeales archaeon]
GIIMILVILESSLLAKVVAKMASSLDYLAKLPSRIYNFMDAAIWGGLLKKFGRPIVGGEYLETHNNIYFRKLILSTFVFSILFFIGGLLLFLQNQELRAFRDPLVSFFFLIITLVLAGVLSGFPVTYTYMKFLSSISLDKYVLRQMPVKAKKSEKKTAATSSASEAKSSVSNAKTPSTVAPTPSGKQLTAKERAELRRKVREQTK